MSLGSERWPFPLAVATLWSRVELYRIDTAAFGLQAGFCHCTTTSTNKSSNHRSWSVVVSWWNTFAAAFRLLFQCDFLGDAPHVPRHHSAFLFFFPTVGIDDMSQDHYQPLPLRRGICKGHSQCSNTARGTVDGGGPNFECFQKVRKKTIFPTHSVARPSCRFLLECKRQFFGLKRPVRRVVFSYG